MKQNNIEISGDGLLKTKILIDGKPQGYVQKLVYTLDIHSNEDSLVLYITKPKIKIKGKTNIQMIDTTDDEKVDEPKEK
jgi:hypothetical protein